MWIESHPEDIYTKKGGLMPPLLSHQGLSMIANTLVFNYHPQNNIQKSKQFAKIKPFSL